MPYTALGNLYAMRRTTSTFAERIAQILRDEGITQADLARAVKVERATVREWVAGRSKTPSVEVPFRIEDRYGYSARWVATGEGPVKVKKFDPSDSIIIDDLEKLKDPSRKEEVRAFLTFQLNRAT